MRVNMTFKKAGHHVFGYDFDVNEPSDLSVKSKLGFDAFRANYPDESLFDITVTWANG